MTDREAGEEHPEPAPTRTFEKRWWMWLLAVLTLVATTDVRIRLGREWDRTLLLESVLALAGIVVTCSLWRGRVVSGFLAIGAALTLFTAIRVAVGS
ncbi:hypothetical protein [Frondihabitans peucedani]